MNTETNSNTAVGKVYLVGAGPGDPGLATVRAMELIRQADCLVYDALANPLLLAEAPADAERIDAGKRAKEHRLTQDETNALLADRALAGMTVVRLKGGDPYVFGRGSEEAMFLKERGVPTEVVPGITSGIAAPAYAGIPVTHRQIACTVTFITGHEDPTKDGSQVDYPSLAKLSAVGGTLCFYMGVGRINLITDTLIENGLSPDTPAAVVRWGTLPDQESLRSTLGQLPADVEAAGLKAPAIIVVGQVASLDADALNWFEQRPLFGQTVVVTRTRHQASSLAKQLADLGARVIEAPTIEIVAPETWDSVDNAIKHIPDFDWLILTSTNGVDGLRDRLNELELDARHLHGVKVAAIGDATAAALKDMGIRPDLVPTEFVAESLAAELIAKHAVEGKRFLLLRADIARPALIEKLEEAGASVQEESIYRTEQASSLPDELLEALRGREVNWLTFTSSSTVSNFVELLGEDRDLIEGVNVASIGPITSQTARDLGVVITTEAATYNIRGLVQTLISATG